MLYGNQGCGRATIYTPFGALSTLLNGCAGTGCVQRQETYDYNNRLQPVRIQLGTAASNAANSCLVYNYYPALANPTSCAIPAQSGGNVDAVVGYFYQDNANPSLNHTTSYVLDSMLRLTSSVATGSSRHNLTFSYDRYGNMTCTTNASTNGPCPNWSFNTATNQITTSGFTYDLAGNLTQDPSNSPTNTYQWDAEGRLAKVVQGATTYSIATYNAFGQVVETFYPGFNAKVEGLFDPLGQELGYYDGVGKAWWDRDIYRGRADDRPVLSHRHLLPACQPPALGPHKNLEAASHRQVTDSKQPILAELGAGITVCLETQGRGSTTIHSCLISWRQ